ncbi:MAG: hypothetical protein ACOYXW_14075 [Actinomycetota bacterium]
MLSVATAAVLRAAGLRWTPAPGDRFVVADRDMDDEVFVVSDLTIEARDYPTGRILAFNGTTEWALDSVAVEQALWLPWEGQLREVLGAAFAGLRRAPAGYEVGRRDGAEGVAWTAARDVEEAYALAVLAERSGRDAAPAWTLLPVAVEGVTWRVHAVPPGSWDATAPDGRPLGDVVRGVVERLGGTPGPDPMSAWDRAAQAAVRRWARGGCPDLDAEDLLGDLLAAARDLARGAGLDDTLDATCLRRRSAAIPPP